MTETGGEGGVLLEVVDDRVGSTLIMRTLDDVVDCFRFTGRSFGSLASFRAHEAYRWGHLHTLHSHMILPELK
jgi:hypothetical protein